MFIIESCKQTFFLELLIIKKYIKSFQSLAMQMGGQAGLIVGAGCVGNYRPAFKHLKKKSDEHKITSI